MSETMIWRRCGNCKKPIHVNEKYLTCSISTCRKATYCSLPCFDAHIAILRHKDAWAEEKVAPKTVEP